MMTNIQITALLMDVYDNDVLIKKSVFIVVLIYSSYVYKLVHSPLR